MTDRAQPQEVRRLKFLAKVYLPCRLNANRSIALRTLHKGTHKSAIATLLTVESGRIRTIAIG